VTIGFGYDADELDRTLDSYPWFDVALRMNKPSYHPRYVRVFSGSCSEALGFLMLSPVVFACFVFVLLWGALQGPCLVVGQEKHERKVSFERDVRPILSDKCFLCHGPDERTREADLRLDQHAGALSQIDLNDPAQSELLKRISHPSPDEVMPPAASNRSLSVAQIDILKRWVEQGAVWGDHWSFSPLVAPQIPKTLPQPDQVQNPIDAFVQVQLADRGWRPSPQADKRTLIRRLTLDLIGIPPTVEEIDAFLTDDSAQAYEKLVDRLLQKPEFGERMSWDWLDAARYADSNGYQGDQERTMWPWRDWVVSAFNDNLPYDQFTIWQLAGDLIEGHSFEQKLATGFCRNHMINGEGGRIPEENRIDYVMDMAETTGTVWLGLTFNCCRCHDHKFDPIKQDEYYKLFAFFNQTPIDGGGGSAQTAPTVQAPSREQQLVLENLREKQAQVIARQQERTRELERSQAAWEEDRRNVLRQAAAEWQVLHPITASAEKQKLEVLEDRSVLAGGDFPDSDSYTLILNGAHEVSSLRLECLQHELLTDRGLSRSGSGNFVLTDFEVAFREIPSSSKSEEAGDKESSQGASSATTSPKIAKNESEPNEGGRTDVGTEWTRVGVSSARATFEQGSLTIASAFDGDSKTGWGVWNGRNVDMPHSAAFDLERTLRPSDSDSVLQLKIVLRHHSDHAKHLIGRFRLSASAHSNASLAPQDAKLVEALAIPAADRTDSQREIVLSDRLSSDASFADLKKEQVSIEKEIDSLVRQFANVMVMADRAEPRKTFVLDRGLYTQPLKEVEMNVPASLPAIRGEQPKNRLALARWLVSDENPLTARVTVNRIWQQFFGIGLVKTAEDFGSQGEVPLQMDLLNWLASDFRTGGWNMKRLVRTIVTSHTYKQDSAFVTRTGNVGDAGDSPSLDAAATPNGNHADEDPENRWLSRGPRFRMPSWMLRDQALAASGLLSRRMGGRSVNGYQPAGVWEEATFGTKTYTQETGESLYRRSLYTFWRRIIGPTVFFDNAGRQVCTIKVMRTNTPGHALLTLNDVTYVEAARALAGLAVSTFPLNEGALPSDGSGTDKFQERIDLIYRRVLSRESTQEEREIWRAAITRSLKRYEGEPALAAQLLSVGESANVKDVNATELAAWTSFCLALFNLDEAVTKE
jgi:Protein of unknown function (DUF1549)/Protein of unknown function (DUF1553)/Planctomycete cytochrome C